MALVALLSNPQSTGNRSLLPQVRSFCAAHPDIFHYEVDDAGQVGAALATIARVKPRVIVINGGDGTVQAALTELYAGDCFGGEVPPVAVLPNGKTNLIALDLGATGSPLAALERIVEIARGDMADHLVVRQMIALSGGMDVDGARPGGENGERPVLGMFLGGAGLAEFILYCRHKIYPLGLPNGLSHFLAGVAGFVSLLFHNPLGFLPRRSRPMRLTLVRGGEMQGSFSVLIVTTLEKLLLGSPVQDWYASHDRMKLLAVEQDAGTMVRAVVAALRGRLGQGGLNGVHLEQDDEIRIDGEEGAIILDGEMFSTGPGKPIVLRSTPPVPFLRLAA